MKVLSLFDGMACGMLAMLAAGIKVDRYVAYEIDKYAVQTSSHNFPMIEHGGDVFKADFTEYSGFDFLVGGSPCTYWSIAQKNNRETEASGMGWELFSQYVRALKEAQPTWFIYENNKSMSNAIRESITETFGFEPICINSALVSAQNRQRLYWVGKRNPNGTYSRVRVDQPEDRGILLRDVLDGICAKELSGKEMDYMVRSTNGKYSDRWTFMQRPGEKEKAVCITANVSKGVPYNVAAEPVALRDKANCLCGNRGGTSLGHDLEKAKHNYVAEPVGTTKEGKSFALTAYYSTGQNAPHTLTKHKGSMAAEPVRIPEYGSEDKARPLGAYYSNNCGGFEHRIFSENPNKQQVDMVAVPVNTTPGGKSQTIKAQYQQTSPRNICCYTSTYGASGVAEPCRVGTWPNEAKNQEKHDSQQYRIYSAEGKGVTLCGNGGGLGAKTGLYAIPIEFDGDIPTKAVSYADGKTYTVYQVKDGQITIKGKQYPIKLSDGFYIIRKLTVSECKRLQTVPEWYDFPVSDAQAYKMLGNGWTVEVIAHLIKATQENELAEEQLDLFKLMGVTT